MAITSHSPDVRVRLEQSDYDALKALAKLHGRNVNQEARWAIRLYVTDDDREAMLSAEREASK